MEKIELLQHKYPYLICRAVEVKTSADSTKLAFHYQLGENLKFCTTYDLPDVKLELTPDVVKLLNYLSIVEGLSYWKLACPKEIYLEGFKIDHKEEEFFKKLITNGLSEFFYRNQIYPLLSLDLISRQSDLPEIAKLQHTTQRKGTLVLVGGGKDSIVSLEILKRLDSSSIYSPSIPFAVNPIDASVKSIEIAGLGKPIYVKRVIDPSLFDLNKTGDFYNGHIPFSAVLAMISTAVASSLNLKAVISSNESSSNEGNVVFNGVKVNHQYSKSFEFENDFANLLKQSKIEVEYLSLLRPLNEIQISKMFSGFKNYHQIFQSCNVKQTVAAKALIKDHSDLKSSDRWCSDCPKCIFVYLMLSLFLNEQELKSIFGKDIRTSQNFEKYCDELTGVTSVKPFECVGTFDEVKIAVSAIRNGSGSVSEDLNRFIKFWDTENRLDDEMKNAVEMVL